MSKFSSFGSRSTDQFSFFSLNDPRTAAIPEEEIELYQRTLNIEDVSLDTLTEPPLIAICDPLRPGYDHLISHLGTVASRSGAAREIFANHVHGLENAGGDLLDVRVKNRSIGKADMDKIDPLFVVECATAIVIRASRGGDVPLPRTSLATWRAMRTQLEQAGALSALIDVAKSGAGAKDSPVDSD